MPPVAEGVRWPHASRRTRRRQAIHRLRFARPESVALSSGGSCRRHDAAGDRGKVVSSLQFGRRPRDHRRRPAAYGFRNLVFGDRHELGFHVDPWSYDYGLPEAVAFTSTDFLNLGIQLLETPFPLTAVIGLWLLLSILESLKLSVCLLNCFFDFG